MSFWSPPNAGSKVAWGISLPILNNAPGETGVINFDVGTFTLGSYNGDVGFTRQVTFIASPNRIWTDNPSPSSLVNFSYSWTSYLHTLALFMLTSQVADSCSFYWIAVGD